MRRKRERVTYAVVAVMAYFASFAGVSLVMRATTCADKGFAGQIICRAQQTIARGIDAFISVVIGGVVSIANAIFQGVRDGVVKIIDFLTLIPRKFIGVVSTLFTGVTNALEKVLGLAATRPPEIGAYATYPGTSGPFGIPGIGWAIIGMVIMGGGLAMYQMSDDLSAFIGGLGQLWTGFSVIIMTVGGMLGLWGMFPKYGMYIIGFGFAAVFITAAWTVRGIIIEETGP